MVRRITRLGFMVACLWSAAVFAQPEITYIDGGTIYTMAGEVIENGIVRMEEGKITYVGRRIAIPKDAIVLDATDKYITPGFILAHSTIGIPEPRSSEISLAPVTPDYRIHDILNLDDPGFAEATMHGITAINTMPRPTRPISGVGVLVKTQGEVFINQVIRKKSALSINLVQKSQAITSERERSLASEVEAIILIRNWLQEASRLQNARENISAGYSDFDIDGHTVNLLKAINHELPTFIYANSPTEIERGISLYEDFNLQVVFVGMNQINKIWDRFTEWKPPIITGPLDLFPQEDWFLPVTLGRVDTLFQRNFPCHLQVDEFGLYGHGGVRNLVYQAAMLQKIGLSDVEAMQTITTIPAQILGVEDQLGTIEIGKDADLNIFSDQPLTSLALPDLVIIDGRVVNEPRRQ